MKRMSLLLMAMSVSVWAPAPKAAPLPRPASVPGYAVVSPVGRASVEMISQAPRLASLDGKTIAVVGVSFMTGVTHPEIKRLIKEHYPSAKVLLLDEPTAGLDPAGTATMMELFRKYNREGDNTVIVVTHNMDQVLSYCDDVVAVRDGTITAHTDVKSFFMNKKLMEASLINPPTIIQIQMDLRERGIDLGETVTDLTELAKAIMRDAGCPAP